LPRLNLIRYLIITDTMKVLDMIDDVVLFVDEDLVLNEFNNTESFFDDAITIQELFELQTSRTPNRTAVLYGDESLTYHELNTKANALAWHLRRIGVEREQLVGLMCERSFEMMIGILGIIKAGGAYLPLSPSDPADRITMLIEDSNTNVLLTQKSFAGKVQFKGAVVALEDFIEAADSCQNPPLINNSTDLVYVIYTSGSTGIPKGVMVEHRSVVNRLNWMQKEYPITSNDVILQKTPFNFDVSVWELFWWFMEGAKVCFLPPRGEKNPLVIIDTINKKGITVMHFVPSLLGVFLGYLSGKKDIKLSSLRLVFSSGEALPGKYVTQFEAILNKDCSNKLVNLYGPTEATVDVTYYDCSLGTLKGKIPIGKPIDNTRIYIVSDDMQLLGVGRAGELLIAGVGLARGYLNRVELTSEKFIDAPFNLNGKVYKTGDLARWFNDGNIEYIGRIDNQVKIRGLRIELGEIEETLLKHESIKDCVIDTRQYSESITIIIAYYISIKEVTVIELKDFLGLSLPEYMIPNQFVKLTRIPLSANGKVDRKSLPEKK
jgi:amino acid adenylation domain-containing protein